MKATARGRFVAVLLVMLASAAAILFGDHLGQERFCQNQTVGSYAYVTNNCTGTGK